MIKTIGILGGGQLGRMLTQAAIPLGFDVIVVDPGENCPAAQVGAIQIVAPFTDEKAIAELAKRTDVITIEIEHVNTAPLIPFHEAGANIHPAPKTIEIIQDKYRQKNHLSDNSIAVAPYADAVDKTFDDLKHELGLPYHLKTKKGAYDGRGNAVIKSISDHEEAIDRFGGVDLYVEAHVPFVKELAVVVVRSENGEVQTYQAVETVHVNNICHTVQSPAATSLDIRTKADALARSAVSTFEGAGVFAVEMFLTGEDVLLINEIAPRVHNSGHHTIDSHVTSQFEQHIRAVTGLPLGSTAQACTSATMINILGERNGEVEITGLDEVLAQPDTHLHLYGKAPTKIDRKMGHITVCGPDEKTTTQNAQKARNALSI